MSDALRRRLRFIILAWILPVVLSYVVYFGYVTNISGDVFSAAQFSAIYDSGIFRFRVLGPALLHVVYQVVDALGLPTYAPEVLMKASPGLDPTFYSAFFYMNTVLACLTASVLFIIVSRLARQAPEIVDLVMIVGVGLLIGTQFVLVPYDMLQALFIVVAIYLTWWGEDVRYALPLLAITTALAALTRESAAVILSFYATAHIDSIVRGQRNPSGRMSHRFSLGVLVASYLAVYVGLRWWFGTNGGFYQAVRIAMNFSENFSVLGGLFLVATVTLILLHDRGRRASLLFLAASAPYWAVVFVVANPREIRMWVPVLLPLLLIQLRANIRLNGVLGPRRASDRNAAVAV